VREDGRDSGGKPDDVRGKSDDGRYRKQEEPGIPVIPPRELAQLNIQGIRLLLSIWSVGGLPMVRRGDTSL
jgi:hypothetical protein